MTCLLLDKAWTVFNLNVSSASVSDLCLLLTSNLNVSGCCQRSIGNLKVGEFQLQVQAKFTVHISYFSEVVVSLTYKNGTRQMLATNLNKAILVVQQHLEPADEHKLEDLASRPALTAT